jgi:Tfp pilus assembly protein PilV
MIKLKSGQSLLEVMVAFTVSVVIGIALVSASLSAQRAANSARNQTQATKLALEYLEDIRIFRDVKGFSSLTSGASCYQINYNSQATNPIQWTLDGAGGCAATNGDFTASTFNNSTVFYRRILITDIPASTVISKKIMVTVNWTEGVNARTVSQETTLTKWCTGQVAASPTCP